MKAARREIHVALALLCIITLDVVPHAQQTAQPGVPIPTPSSTVPRSVPFNGQLIAPNGDARTASVMLTFGLYTDQQGGTPLWTEQQLVTLDADGRYAVVLGRMSPDGLPGDAFAAGIPRWLGVQVDGEKEEPRFMLLSVPYALKAGDADTVGGKPVSEFVLTAQLFDQASSPLKDAITLTMKAAGYPPKAAGPSSTVNRLAKFVGTNNEVGDSLVFEDSGRIGINTVPLYPFHVVASANYQTLRLDNTHVVGSSFTLGPTGFAGERVYSLLATGPGASTGAGYLTVYDEVAGQYRLVVNPSGDVGVGTAAPISPLHVSSASAASTTFTLENLSGQTSRRLFLSSYGSAGAGLYWPGGLDSANTSSLWSPNLFVLRGSNGLVFSGSSAAEHMRITPSGNVGIGTSPDPDALGARLDVHSSFYDGVVGRTGAAGRSGVVGVAIHPTERVYGVRGQVSGMQGVGVLGSSLDGGYGVYGVAASAGTGVFGVGFNGGTGIYGESNGGTAVRAVNLGAGAAVDAVNESTSGFGDGVRATTSSPDAVGIWARNLAADGTAGRFDGNVAVNGTLTKSSGSFKIDHPLDPENQYLSHSFVESPDMMNIYNGNVTTDANGDAVVTLPAWFEALNSDYRYQLTCIGTFAQAMIAEEVKAGHFTIKTSAPHVRVSWQVTGSRQDAWARQHRIPVEEAKPSAERGTYLHPEVFQQPANRSVDSTREDEVGRQRKTTSEQVDQSPVSKVPTVRPPER